MSADPAVTRGTGDSEALWYTGVGKCAIRSVRFSAPQAGEIMVETLFSAVSRGTERLVFRGEVPESEWQRMRAPFQEGDFPHPVKYGYANVGRVIDGDADLVGRIVFSLFPHQSVFTLPAASCVPVPDGIPAERAVLAANMETAISAIWDGKPSPGDHICVVGGGVVGLLTAYLGSRIPGTRVTLVDVNERRTGLAEAFGLRFALPGDAPRDQDLVFHTSASPEGLATALAAAGDGTSIIEMSWYGAGKVLAPLGADFHSRRLKLVSSQVGTIAAERQSRWTYRRRLELALSLLQDPVLDRILSHRVAFRELPEQLPDLLNRSSDVLATLVLYDGATGRTATPF